MSVSFETEMHFDDVEHSERNQEVEIADEKPGSEMGAEMFGVRTAAGKKRSEDQRLLCAGAQEERASQTVFYYRITFTHPKTLNNRGVYPRVAAVVHLFLFSRLQLSSWRWSLRGSGVPVSSLVFMSSTKVL